MRCVGWISLAFIRKEVFFPFGLYIILKRSWDTSLAHARSAQREATLGSCSIVPGARVPNGCWWKSGYFIEMVFDISKQRAAGCETPPFSKKDARAPIQAR